MAALLIGCGEQRARVENPWTRADRVRQLPGDPLAVATRESAEAVIKHQRQDHCKRRLVAVRCDDHTGTWTCRYRDDAGSGSTVLQKAPGPDGLTVTC